MESFRNEEFGGLVPNMTYTKTDHQGSFKTRIVRIHEDSTFTPLTNFLRPGQREGSGSEGKIDEGLSGAAEHLCLHRSRKAFRPSWR